MARSGTPLGGLDEIAERVFSGPAYTLVCYTNTQDSLGPNTVAADLTQPDEANGYAPIVLDGEWTWENGVTGYTHPEGPNADPFGNPCWFPTGTWSAVVTGVAMIYGERVQHFMDLRDGAGDPATFVAAAGKRFEVDMSTLAA